MLHILAASASAVAELLEQLVSDMRHSGLTFTNINFVLKLRSFLSHNRFLFATMASQFRSLSVMVVLITVLNSSLANSIPHATEVDK